MIVRSAISTPSKALKSEGYKAKASAENGIESVKKNAPTTTASRRRPRATTARTSCFVLKAGNREVIGTSERYSSNSACDAGIAAVQRAAAETTTVDET